jgi:hypothetical protein
MTKVLLSFFITVSAIFLLVQPVFLGFSFEADTEGFALNAKPRLFCGLSGPEIRIEKKRGESAVLIRGEKRKALSPPERKPPAGSILRLIRQTLSFPKLTIRGEIGLAEEPCAAVLLSGGFRTLLSALLPLTDPGVLKIIVEPVFEKDVFSFSAAGIIKLKTGRIIIETIKMQKEIKHESSH